MSKDIITVVPFPPELKKEQVDISSKASVPYFHISWIMQYLTARLKCSIYDKEGQLLNTITDSSGLSPSDAVRIGMCIEHESIVIHHIATDGLGGIKFERLDDERWLLKVIPTITRVDNVGEKKSVIYLVRELFLSAKYAAELINYDGLRFERIEYRQPLYYHPKFETKAFDPTYFTVD